jgi:hypothetical protein
MGSKRLITFVKYAAITGNSLFVLWILYNGINEGFRGTTLEIISYIGLLALLTVNSFIIIFSPGIKE